MQKILSLAKKELFYYFNNPAGYIVAILFATFANFLFMKDFFLRGTSSLRPFFDVFPWILLVFVPALSMRIFAEENRSHTLEVLLSLPIEEKAIVLGKFTALLIFTLLSLVLTLSVPLTVFLTGRLFVAEIVVSYLGVFLMASSFISASLFFSSLTSNQIVAFLSSVVVLFFLTVLGGDFLSTVLSRGILEQLAFFTPLYHYGSFLKGVVDLRAVFYFTSLTALFLFITVVSVERRG